MPPQNMDPWSFAHGEGDPAGNQSYEQAKANAEAMLRANPNWQGNESFRVENGRVVDARSWLERNGWVFPAAVGAGIAAAPAIGALGGGGTGSAAGAGTAPLGGVTPPVVGAASASEIPFGVGPTVFSGAGTGAATSSVPEWLRNLLPDNAGRALGPLVAALASGGGGGSGSGGFDLPFLERAYNDARQQNAMQQARYRRVDPLHEAMTQLAFSRMPVASRQGIDLPRVPLPGGGQ